MKVNLFVLAISIFSNPIAASDIIHVYTSEELEKALSIVHAGDVIHLNAGIYIGKFEANIDAERDSTIILE